MANFELSKKQNVVAASQSGEGVRRDKIELLKISGSLDCVFDIVTWTKETSHRADIRLSKRDTIVTLESMLAMAKRSY